MHRYSTILAAGLLATSGAGVALAESPTLQSAGALAFNDGNVLFIGDTRAGVVHAYDLAAKAFDDQADYQLGRAETFEGRTIIADIDERIAALLGVGVEEIQINDMVVHGPTRQIFLSAHRGLGPDAEAVVLKVDHGELELLDLGMAAHSSISVGQLPADKTLEFGQLMNTLAITDIDYHDGEIFVAGISNEEFSSKLRRIAFPFTGAVGTTSIEIWHAVHAQYETRAPIITQEIVTLDGEPTLIAVYACTPIVRIPLAELQDGAQIRGTMIGEMGFGNTPVDIVAFGNPMDKNDYVLVTNTNRSAAQIPLQAVASAEPMASGKGVGPVFTVAGVVQYPMPLSGTLHLDLVDAQWAVSIRRNPHDPRQIDLHTLPVPFFFDRADHIVEMNWADGPDPFGYKSAPPVAYN